MDIELEAKRLYDFTNFLSFNLSESFNNLEETKIRILTDRKKSSELGYVPAKIALAINYLVGDIVQKDENLARKLFAEIEPYLDNENDSEILRLRGSMYLNAYFYEKDIAKSLKYLHKAIDMGNLRACLNIMWIYEFEESVKDHATAMKFLKLAAEKGEPHAMYLYGWRLYFGNGVPEDKEAALPLFLCAAEECVPHAMMMLVTYYVEGKHVKADLGVASSYYNIAKAYGLSGNFSVEQLDKIYSNKRRKRNLQNGNAKNRYLNIERIEDITDVVLPKVETVYAKDFEFDDSEFSSEAMNECLNWKPTECNKIVEKCMKCGHTLKPVYWGILNGEIEKQIRSENKYIIGMSCYGDIDNKPDFCCTNCGESYKCFDTNLTSEKDT